MSESTKVSEEPREVEELQGPEEVSPDLWLAVSGGGTLGLPGAGQDGGPMIINRG